MPKTHPHGHPWEPGQKPIHRSGKVTYPTPMCDLLKITEIVPDSDMNVVINDRLVPVEALVEAARAMQELYLHESSPDTRRLVKKEYLDIVDALAPFLEVPNES